MTEQFTFFWHGPFSQWHRSGFAIDGQAYNTAEQYMMAEKARLFGDTAALARILTADHPRDQKAAGRTVAGFDDIIWRQAARDIVYRGNHAKFTTDATLRDLLFQTAGTTLVEASPQDPIWGIGLAADHPDAANRATWRGTNWLGETLTKLRQDLLGETASH